MNRAPTLHRLGIQAFEPLLVEGKAIQLHPLVCQAYNADFDGDQMAVHIPLSIEAQIEARVLMMSTNNILSPANGQPIIVPNQDIVLGLYYMTRERPLVQGEGKIFSDEAEVIMAYDAEAVSLHAAIEVRIKGQRMRTTVGRVILSQVLPEELGFDAVNLVMDKKALKNLVGQCYRTAGTKATVILSDRLKDMGYKFATKSGLSICVADMVIPQRKQGIIDQAMAEVQGIEKQYKDGIITDGEKYNKAVDIWAKATEDVAAGDDGRDLHRRGFLPRGPGSHHRQLQPHLHDGRLRRPRLQGPDEAAGRHARPDGQALRRDHRDPHHRQLPRGADGAAVLQLHPRRPQGPGRHRAQDRQQRLLDPPPGGREPGRHRHRDRLRHHRRHRGGGPARGRRGDPAGGRARFGPHGAQGHHRPPDR